MKIIRSLSSLRGTRGRRPALNRRAAFMVALGGAVGLASQSNSARAETRVAKSQFQNLKAVGSEHQISTIDHRGNTFAVATADGRSAVFPDVNLRFKIDSSDNGPPAGRPVILPSGMMGDRATVFFASPLEIGTLVKHQS